MINSWLIYKTYHHFLIWHRASCARNRNTRKILERHSKWISTVRVLKRGNCTRGKIRSSLIEVDPSKHRYNIIIGRRTNEMNIFDDNNFLSNNFLPRNLMYFKSLQIISILSDCYNCCWSFYCLVLLVLFPSIAEWTRSFCWQKSRWKSDQHFVNFGFL